MESSKEKIEAQLCAYVEGELDDAERAEIERHLAANPQHQSLIAELRAASGLLRDLPRVAAPVELNESLCGQLERSALLNPTDDDSNPALNVNRWPQFTAVAAVLLLALGLGLVVYYALPPSGGQAGNQVAVDGHGIKQAAPPIDSFAGDRDADGASSGLRKDERAKGMASGATGDSLGRPEASGAEAKSPDAARPDTARQLESGVQDDLSNLGRRAGRSPAEDLNVARMRGVPGRGMVTPAEVESVRKWVNESLGADNNFFKSAGTSSLYLVVSTQDVASANGQLAAYFKGNGIHYMEDESRTAAPEGAGLTANGRGSGTDLYRAYALNAPAPGGGEKLSNAGGVGGGGGAASVRDGDRPAASSQQEESPAPAPTAKPDFSGDQVKRGLKKTASQGAPADSSRYKRELEAATPQTPAAVAAPAPAAGAGAAVTMSRTASVAGEVNVRPDVESAAKAKAADALPGRLVARTGKTMGDETWDLQTVNQGTAPARFADENGAGRDTVIIARMNRRQANELSVALSREQGQRAELKEFAPSPVDGMLDSAKALGVVTSRGMAATLHDDARLIEPGALTLGGTAGSPALKQAVPSGASEGATVGKAVVPTTRPVDVLDKEVRSSPLPFNPAVNASVAGPVDALHLQIDPMDEPVYLVIVVKAEKGAAGGIIEGQTPAISAPANPAPANATESKPATDLKK